LDLLTRRKGKFNISRLGKQLRIMLPTNLNMKKIYFLTVLLFTMFLAVCKADDYQPGYVILKDGKHVSGLIKLYKDAPWKNQRFIWFKDSAAYAANPSIHAKKYFSSELKSYQAGSHTFVRVHYIDQSYLNLRTLVNNYHMLERVSNGRIVAYMYYSYPPEILGFGDSNGERVEASGDNQAMRYRIIFKKDGAKHFHNAYGYGLASYFKDTPQVLQKYDDGSYGNVPNAHGASLYDRIATLCKRTIFTSQKETKGIIAAFNDYDHIYNPEIEQPGAPNALAQFKPYIFKGTVVNSTSHTPETDVTITYVDSLTQATVKQTLTNVNGVYQFLVENNRPFSIRVEKKGFVTKSLNQAAGTGVNGTSVTAIGAGQGVGSGVTLAMNSGSGNGAGSTAAMGSGSPVTVGSADGMGAGAPTGGTFVSPAVSLEPIVNPTEQSFANNQSAGGNSSGQSMMVNNILYDFGHATLRAEAIPVLDSLVKEMEAQPKLTVILSAHTDSVGSDAYNLKLSQERAKMCTEYLISKGISNARISAVGYGKANPIAPNTLPNGQDNPDGRQLNRRVEFTVKETESRITKLASN
jgi:outer membrane protein OmpA-like peptidoglycan-associated protein